MEYNQIYEKVLKISKKVIINMLLDYEKSYDYSMVLLMGTDVELSCTKEQAFEDGVIKETDMEYLQWVNGWVYMSDISVYKDRHLDSIHSNNIFDFDNESMYCVVDVSFVEELLLKVNILQNLTYYISSNKMGKKVVFLDTNYIGQYNEVLDRLDIVLLDIVLLNMSEILDEFRNRVVGIEIYLFTCSVVLANAIEDIPNLKFISYTACTSDEFTLDTDLRHSLIILAGSGMINLFSLTLFDTGNGCSDLDMMIFTALIGTSYYKYEEIDEYIAIDDTHDAVSCLLQSGRIEVSQVMSTLLEASELKRYYKDVIKATLKQGNTKIGD